MRRGTLNGWRTSADDATCNDDHGSEGPACNAAYRVLKLRPFDVQLAAGGVLHHGAVAELATGEGKTLVASFPTFLNALTAKGMHVATVNDYLAKRDAEWMGPIYQFLGMS